MNAGIARIMDANLNRAREALRLLEDYARFVLSNAAICARIKEDRHTLGSMRQLLLGEYESTCRDTPGDVGTHIKDKTELTRSGMTAVLETAGSRASEALRVLEELAKMESPQQARELEAMRYRVYTLGQTLAGVERQRGHFPPVHLCVLVTESLCSLPWRRTIEKVLSGGADCLQLREKDLSDLELLTRAKWLASACRAAGAIAIINDRLDIALAAQADGVHLGQQDIPCVVARKIAGPEFFIGVSTQALAEAREAVNDGASYIGIGTMFPSATKVKPHIAGTAYAREIQAAALSVPAMAIGGITAKNLPEVLSTGIQSVAVSGAIIGSPDPEKVCRELIAILASGSE